MQTFTTLGGSVSTQTFPLNEPLDLRQAVEVVRLTTPDAIFLPLFHPQANLLINQLHTEDIEIPVIGSDTLFLPDSAVSIGEAGTDLYITQIALSGAAYERFQEQWRSQIGIEPASNGGAFAYDAINFLLEGVEDVTLSSENQTLVIPRSSLQARLADTTAYGGLTGTITCGGNGECGAINLYGVYQLDGAEIQGENWPPALVWRP